MAMKQIARKGEERNEWLERVSATDEIWNLEERGKVALYMLKDKKSAGNPFGKEPLYVVWNGKHMKHCAPGYIWGWESYEREVNGNG